MTIRVNRNSLGCNAKVSVDVLLKLASVDDISSLAADCGVVAISGIDIAHTIDTVFPFSEDVDLLVKGAVLHCSNDLLCKGVKPISASFSLGISSELELRESELISHALKRFLLSSGLSVDNCHTFNASETSITISMLGAWTALPPPVAGVEYYLALTKSLGAVHLVERSGEIGFRARDEMQKSCLNVAHLIKRFAVAPTTDISGYGLLGHMVIAAKKYSLDVEVSYKSVPLVSPEVDAEISCSAISNLDGFSAFIDSGSFSGAPIYSLFSGETNGPILIFVDANRFGEFSEGMSLAGVDLTRIGSARISEDGYSVRGKCDG